MSWVRFHSECHQGGGFRESRCSAAPGPCPGSDVYVFDNSNGFVECCGCKLPGKGGSFMCDTEEEMRMHLREHVQAGHHVPMSLYDDGLTNDIARAIRSINIPVWYIKDGQRVKPIAWHCNACGTIFSPNNRRMRIVIRIAWVALGALAYMIAHWVGVVR